MLEDSEGMCGYVMGVLDSQGFYEQHKRVWLPSLSCKYPSQSKCMNKTEQVCAGVCSVPQHRKKKNYHSNDIYYTVILHCCISDTHIYIFVGLEMGPCVHGYW